MVGQEVGKAGYVCGQHFSEVCVRVRVCVEFAVPMFGCLQNSLKRNRHCAAPWGLTEQLSRAAGGCDREQVNGHLVHLASNQRKTDLCVKESSCVTSTCAIFLGMIGCDS